MHGNKISYANLDGSGGGDLATGKATVSEPWGLAIDAAAGRVYWANNDGNMISYANLDGTGGHDLNTAGATVNGPWGVALTRCGQDLLVEQHRRLALLCEPRRLGRRQPKHEWRDFGPREICRAARGPERRGGARGHEELGLPMTLSGSKLSCSSGSWAPDLPGAFLYRAPQRFAYAWSKNGVPIAAT